jgi:hypothetical protein
MAAKTTRVNRSRLTALVNPVAVDGGRLVRQLMSKLPRQMKDMVRNLRKGADASGGLGHPLRNRVLRVRD